MPCPDLVETMNLRWDQDSGWYDENQDLVSFCHNIGRSSVLFIKKDILDNYLSKSGRSLVFSRYGRKQFSQGFGDNSKLVEVSSRYVYTPNGCSLELISEESERFGFNPVEELE